MINIFIILFLVFHARSDKGKYKLNYNGAHALCKSMGSHLATYGDLKDALENDGFVTVSIAYKATGNYLTVYYRYESCRCGWLMDKTARYPMNSNTAGCGNRPGIHSCSNGVWDAYCYQGWKKFMEL